MKQQSHPITCRIVVTHPGPAGIVATVSGRITHFRNREDLFRAAVLLAEASAKSEQAHPTCVEGA